MVQPFEGMPYRRRGVSLLIGFWLAFSPLGGEAQQLRWLGVLSDGFQSGAWDVTSDGSTVVGWATVAMFRAFRWTPATGMQDLGTLGGSMSEAYGVSADGAVIVGYAVDYLDRMRAFRWTEARGMENLNQTYAALLSDGSELWEVTALSPDGRYLVGWGYNAASDFDEAFLLDTRIAGDVDGNGCVDDADLLRVLFAFGQSGSNLPEDINGDRIVDDADLLVVLFNFGRGC